MKPLLGPSFVPRAVIVSLSADDIRTINKVLNGHRSAHRRTEKLQEIATKAALLRDCCSLSPHLSEYPTKGPLFSIELKPKQGFLHNEDSLTKDHAIMAKVCRFCMMQYYKISKGAVSSKSGYCPLDLFSGSPKRMKHALRELQRTPQNNLRIFEDKKLIFSEENKVGLSASLEKFFGKGNFERNKDSFCSLVTQALLSVFPQETTEYKTAWNTPMKHEQQFCINSGYDRHEEAKGQLPAGCILDRILRVQKLDSLDITYVYKMFLKVKEQLSSDICTGGAIDTTTEYPSSHLPPNIGKLEQQNCESDYMYMTRKIWEFLVALTAKDYSLMLSVQQLIGKMAEKVPPENLLKDSDSKQYLFSFSVMDLDAKSLSKVEKVYSDTRNIIEAYHKAQ